MRIICCLAFVLLAVCSWSPSIAQSSTITYQGQLQQSGGPFTGTANLEFRLFTQLSGGAQVGSTQTRADWPVENGLFQVDLDFGIAAFNEQARFLEVRVNGTPLNPRQAVGASPVALFALSGNDGPPGPVGPQGPEGPTGPAGDSLWEVNGPDLLFEGGRVGLGTTLPSAGLHSVQTNTSGLGGETNTGQAGVFGWNKGTVGSARGVQGVSNSPSGQGVYGWVSTTSGTNTGVYGESPSTDGRGVFGLATATSGTSFGVRGTSVSNEGRGVMGFASSTSGPNFGVWGEAAGTSGRGVFGRASANSGVTYGVRGQVDSSSGFASYFSGPAGSRNYIERRLGVGTQNPGAMLDVVPDGTGNAVRATHANGSRGILGDVNAGVYGERGPGSTPKGWLGYINAGVFGQAGTAVNNALAGRFEGNVLVTGALSKGGGSFRIDHPLDPENQYLFHSFVESPDMMNIYNGNVVTDQAGFAEVELPGYFEALNTDFRYQLTVIGAFAQAIIAEEVSGNRFVIATDLPQVKVSWQVTGIRDDAWARANRIEVEVPKAEHERGQFLHPEAFGVNVTRKEN